MVFQPAYFNLRILVIKKTLLDYINNYLNRLSLRFSYVILYTYTV
jgi:hypothetical protein